jgi:hypothetical protein
MAETKLTAKQLKSQIAALLNKKAKETDEVEKAKLKKEIDRLNAQLKEINKQESEEKNLSVVEKAKKELERLNKLDPGTPGVAPAKAEQERIIADATKKGLPKPTPTPTQKPKTETETTPTETPSGVKKAVTKPSGVPSGPTGPTTPYTAQQAADLAKTVGGTNYFSAKYGSASGTEIAPSNQSIDSIYTLARSKYGNVDSIFLYDPELKQLLIDAVGDPATATDDMNADEFARRLAASDWAIRNATTYAKRDAERREYEETLDKYNQQLELADTQEKKDAILAKIGQLKTTSTYARGLASAKAYIEAAASGLTGTLSPERLDAFVKKMYDSANDKDPNIINRELAALISYKPGMQLGGSVGGDLTALRATARANGFNLDTSFGSSINDWLQRLAKGESIETFKNTIRGAAKLGLPDKVANLLDQGLDLKDIYAPYRNVMASVLEVAPDSISLDDKTLRMAIGPEKEMSIYDFQRLIRKDSRWQYTNNAREEASDSVLKVLKDFGFQG